MAPKKGYKQTPRNKEEAFILNIAVRVPLRETLHSYRDKYRASITMIVNALLEDAVANPERCDQVLTRLLDR